MCTFYRVPHPLYNGNQQQNDPSRKDHHPDSARICTPLACCFVTGHTKLWYSFHTHMGDRLCLAEGTLWYGASHNAVGAFSTVPHSSWHRYNLAQWTLNHHRSDHFIIPGTLHWCCRGGTLWHHIVHSHSECQIGDRLCSKGHCTTRISTKMPV